MPYQTLSSQSSVQVSQVIPSLVGLSNPAATPPPHNHQHAPDHQFTQLTPNKRHACLERLVRVRSVVGEVTRDLESASQRLTLTKGNLRRTSFWKRGTGPMKSATAAPAVTPHPTRENAKGRRSLWLACAEVESRFLLSCSRPLQFGVLISWVSIPSLSLTGSLGITASIPTTPNSYSPDRSSSRIMPFPQLNTYSGVRPAKR